MENLSRRERERNMRESEMILAAEKIFRQKGYEGTSMDDIAREAQFTKRTLYQYFPSKDDLFFAVLQKGLKSLQICMSSAAGQPANGYEKIRQLFEACYRFYLEYPEFFRLLNHVGYARQNIAGKEENRQGYFASNDASFEGLAAIIAAGQADGSISADLDARKTAMSLLFMMTGFFNQLAMTGNTFTKHFGLDVQEFSTFTIDMLLRTLPPAERG